MLAIVGLGNPGKNYENTVHNLGFMALDYFAIKNNVEFVKNKYSSFNKTEIGKKILSRNATLEELASYAEQMGAPEVPASGRAEYLEGVINNVLFG